MAIAGLQNVPALDPSILRDSRSSSLGQHGNHEGTSSSPSSILKMWRELEDEWLASRAHGRLGGSSQHEINNGPSSGVSISNLPQGQNDENGGGFVGSLENGILNDTVGESHTRSVADNEVDQNTTSEQSQGFGEVERERVRQISCEWMNSGRNGMRPNSPSMISNPRAQLLDQTELERVRIVREWVQMASQRRNTSGGNGEEQGPDFGSQIQQVREGLVLDHNHLQTDNSRRELRKLCGRQALLDLLEINKLEVQRELQVLSEHSPVSCFAYRNRIQSLLRIRLLHNARSIENSRPNSVAESELGFLRERQTVSGLREGFLSRLDNNVASNNLSSGSCNNNNNGLGQNDCTDSAFVVVDDEHAQVRSDGEHTVAGPSSDRAEDFLSSIEEINSQGSTLHIESRQELEVARNSGSEDNVHENQEQVIALVSSSNGSGEQNLQETHQGSHGEIFPGSEEHHIYDVSPHSSDDATVGELVTIVSARSSSTEDANLVIYRESSRFETGDSIQFDETHESFHDQHDDDNDDEEEHNLGNELRQSVDLEDIQSDDLDLHDSTSQGHRWEVQVREVEEEDQEWSVRVQEQRPGVSLDELPGDDGLPNESREQSHPERSVWHESRSQGDTLESWLPATSDPGMTSTRRANLDHFFYDDHAHSMEIRELLSRRTVSSLLHSGFRDSLDQLVQSYVERQSQHTSDDWEMHEMQPPPFATLEFDQGSFMDIGEDGHDDNEESSDLDENPDLLQSIPMPPPLPSWEQQFRHSHWSRDVCQRPGIELEMINDLRIEMARIQQRLNNMQRMLEACMDMQLELQRSVRQEVSAALNRSIHSSEEVENVVAKTGSKWDCVRKGICCICSESNIDSLLYRCGHMCACTNCANLLVEGKGKCPMCQAPVVEVVRAYTI